MGNTKIVGKLDSWDSSDITPQTSFMNLEEGDNIVRCVSSPYQSYSHWLEDTTGQTRKVRCCLKDCPACKLAGDDDKKKAKARWLVAVLNRKTDSVAVVELGPQVVRGIKAVAGQKNGKGQLVFGDPRGYDLNIKRGPKGSNPLYTVLPYPKEALTDEEKAMIRSAMEKLDLQAMVEPPTPDEICEKLGIEVVKSTPAVDDTDSPPPSTDDDSDSLFDFDAK